MTSELTPPSAPARGWGALAVVFYALHARTHLLAGHPEELLWACHLGSLLVGIGILLRWPLLNAVGFLWLCVGNLLWGLDLATGAALMPTSLLTHLGGLAVGVWGLLHFGMPHYSALLAILGFALLQQLCRWATPSATNVNLAHDVWAGWEGVFPSYLAYEALLLLTGGAILLLIEWLVRRGLATWPRPACPADARRTRRIRR